MSKIGRKYGHLLGLFLTLLGVTLTGLTLWMNSFLGFCLGNLLCGVGAAFNNQIRFSAAEGAIFEEKALVHSWVLMCSLCAAFLGPWMIQYGHTLLHTGEYTGSLALLFIALFGTMVLLICLPQSPPSVTQSTDTPKITAFQIVSQVKFWLPALCGITAFATMTLIMSATPLQMHEIAHFSTAITTMTYKSHIIAMFLPSLFSGILLAKMGIRRLIAAGIFLFLLCIAIAYTGTTCHDYWWSLVLLGVGWNFLFLAGSTWVSQTYTGPERFAAQGLNDGLVYGTQSLASLAAGWLLFAYGWTTLVLIPLPLLIGLVGFVWMNSKKNSRNTPIAWADS